MPQQLPDRVQAVCRGLGWPLLLTLLLVQVWALYLVVPGPGDPWISGQDKLAHAVLFGLPFALALLLGSRWASVGILAHAVLSEPLQGLLTSTRTADPWDTVADLTGIAIAAAVVELVRRRARTAPSTRHDTARVAP